MNSKPSNVYRPMPRHRLVTQESYPFLLGTLCLAIIGLIFSWTAVTASAAGMLLFIAYFFRNPKRNTPSEDSAVISPADGKVLGIKYAVKTPFTDKPANVISIFMSVFNGHINRLPITGEIKKVVYQPGKFLVASLDKAMEHNEKNSLLIADEQGREVLMTQVAGLVARRIVCYMKAGMRGTKGQRCGLIRFGSRVDIYLPTNTEILVNKGDNVRSGLSILGKFS
jgi:phosphatidylserine decarboxylase